MGPASALAFWAARYAWWKAVPDPANVTPWSPSTSTTRSGTKASNDSDVRPSRHPRTGLVNSQVMPPMWVNGKTRALRSVVGADGQALGHGFRPTAIADGPVGVARALRVGGRAGRVEQPAHGRRWTPCWRCLHLGQGGRVAGRQRTAGRHDRDPLEIGGDGSRPWPRSRRCRSRGAPPAAWPRSGRTQKPTSRLRGRWAAAGSGWPPAGSWPPPAPADSFQLCGSRQA